MKEPSGNAPKKNHWHWQGTNTFPAFEFEQTEHFPGQN